MAGTGREASVTESLPQHKECDEEKESNWRFIGILDLPIRSLVALDGQPIVLQRDDFVGFSNVPSLNKPPQDDAFHLVTVRAGRMREEARNVSSGGSSSLAVTVGFVLPIEGPFIRRYDPATEEVSAAPLDDPFTVANLRNRIQHGQVDPHRIIDYTAVVGESQRQHWHEQTSFVSPELLARRGIAAGDKIVPGAFGGDDDPSDVRLPTYERQPKEQQSIVDDGKAICYPSVPVVLATTSKDSGPRRVDHAGTKRFLAQLDPSQRTKLLLDPHPGARALETILEVSYDSSWAELLGDAQLSWVLFQHLHCFASFQHWRDLVALVASVDDAASVQAWEGLYAAFLRLLAVQVRSMEADLFDDLELSGDNVLIPSWYRLLQTASQVASSHLETARLILQRALQQRFPNHFPSPLPIGPTIDSKGTVDDDEEDEDDDGPIVVASEEVDASWARIHSFDEARKRAPGVVVEYSSEERRRYPVLFAAKLPSEDVVMTCARALDEATDVSLVREAADYLEQVEARRRNQ